MSWLSTTGDSVRPMTEPSALALAAQVVRHADAAGARHVLHDDVGIAGDVPLQVRRQRAGVEVVAAADIGRDDQRDVVALVELLRRSAPRRGTTPGPSAPVAAASSHDGIASPSLPIVETISFRRR